MTAVLTGHEEWRAVPGFEGYEASSDGRVRSWRRRGPGGFLKETPDLLATHLNRGYLRVGLMQAGKRVVVNVSRVVALAFHGEPSRATSHAAHNNGVKTDNRPCNVRWATPKENAGDRRRHGHDPVGTGNGNAKLTPEQVVEIRAARGVESQAALGRRYGVSQEQISAIQRRISWTSVA